MILPNEAPREYRDVLELTSTRSVSGPAPLLASATASMTRVWGIPFDESGTGTPCGYRLTISNKMDHGVESYVGSFELPELSIDIAFSGSGWISPLDCEVYFIDLALTVLDCNSWTVEWTELVVTVNGSPVYSESAVRSLSGTDYSPDNNALYAQGSALASILGPPMVVCLGCPSGPPFATWNDSSSIISGGIIFGWEHKPAAVWVQETLDLITTWAVPPQALCDCEQSLIVPTAPSNNCLDIHIPFNARTLSTRVLYGTLQCYCDEDPVFSFPVYYFYQDYLARTAKCWADPIIADNRKTYEESGSRCWDSGGAPGYTVAFQTVSRANAKARWYADVGYVEGDSYCSLSETSPPICMPDIFGHTPEFSCDPIPDCGACGYDAYSGLSWVDTTCAGTTITQPWHHQSLDGRLSMVGTQNPGSIVVFKRSDYSTGPWAVESVVAEGEHPKHTQDPITHRIYVIYQLSGALRLAYSDDEGATWTDASLSVSAIRPSIEADLDGNVVMAWFVFDSGSSGPGTIQAQFRGSGDTDFGPVFTLKDGAGVNISVAEEGFGNIRMANESSGRWTMTIMKDGDSVPTQWCSADAQTIGPKTWIQVT